MGDTEEERRAYLYRHVGEAMHLAQTLELQIATVIAILKDHLESSPDVEGLIVPENRGTLGQLMKQIRPMVSWCEDTEELLAAALEKRNYISHHFFNTNVYAFAVPEVFESTRLALRNDTRDIAIGVAITQAWVLSMCEALKLDLKAVLFKQSRRDESGALRGLKTDSTRPSDG